MDTFNNDNGSGSGHMHHKKYVAQAAVAALILLTVFLFAQTISVLKEYRYIGAGLSATNTISVSGEGEVFAVPDIATFTFSVREEADDVATAQDAAAESSNSIIAFLKGEGIEEKDIKTTSYNVYPRYEYQQAVCRDGYCPPSGERELVGYEVSQSIQVKVRDTDKAGALLSGVGSRGVSDVSGLSFEIDDDDALQQEARRAAIADARDKAQVLARDLGVTLVRVVNFNESGGGVPIMYARAEMSMDSSGFGGSIAPDVPVGENKIVSNVTITYEIR
jgi:hypothetical protein